MSRCPVLYFSRGVRDGAEFLNGIGLISHLSCWQVFEFFFKIGVHELADKEGEFSPQARVFSKIVHDGPII